MKAITAILLFLVCSIAGAQNQGSDKFYYIDVLIDVDKNIYFDNKNVELKDVPQMTRKKVESFPFVPGKEIIYRVFGDRNLDLGDIIDLEEKMKAGFSEIRRRRRYLLETREIPLDKDNWIEQLNKLNLKAVDQQE